MTTAKLNVIWANKPGCRLAVAEFWVGRDYLWMVLFVDDDNAAIRVELLPPVPGSPTFVFDLDEAERLIAAAKQDLLAMAGSSASACDG